MEPLESRELLSVAGLDGGLQSLAYAVDESPIVVESRISAGSDDAEETSSGGMRLTSSDLELVYDGSNQNVGMRFNDLNIPQGATITNAYLQFQVDETSSKDTSVTFRGEDTDNAATFDSSRFNISSRPTTAASVDWAPVAWSDRGEAGLDQRTPNLGPIVQEIVDRAGWSNGSSLVMLVTGSGERTAESYNGDSDGAALLHVEYTTGDVTPPENSAPVLSPIGDKAVVEGSTLQFTAMAADPNVGDALTFSLDAGAPAGAGIDPVTGVFRFASGQTGDYPITVRVTDNGSPALSDAETITITVTQTGDVGGTVHVPRDYSTIQAALDAAADGDVVLVAPGKYTEQLTIAGKSVTLASLYYTTGDESYIDQTIIDGGGNTVISVDSSVGPDSKIVGLTIQNGVDGIYALGEIDILNNKFYGNGDAIDYEAGGGIVRGNLFENNSDDAIDLDGPTAALIENNIIRNNGDDGIEVRLHAYSGPTLNIVIRDNVITGNGEDGIQLIDYSDTSDRVFTIERNLIAHNAMAGIGVMDNGDTKEDYRAASMPERVHLVNNTFVGNAYGVTGGDNLVAVNNLFVDTAKTALLGVNGNSIAAYNLFYGNGSNSQDSNVDAATSVTADPRLDGSYHLQAGSPAIDAGTAQFAFNGQTVVNLPAGSYAGAAPDLGMVESDSTAVNRPPTTLGIGSVSVDVDAPNTVIDLFAAFDDFEDADNRLAYTVRTNTNPGLFSATSINGSQGTLTLDYLAGATGEATLTVRATDTGGLYVESTFMVIVTETPSGGQAVTVERRVGTGSDDAEERPSGSMRLTSSDLELVYDTVGIRFAGLGIPQGATITDAYLLFQVDETSSATSTLMIHGQDIDNAPTFTRTMRNISSRAATSASVVWAAPAWDQIGEAGLDQRTPNLAPIVQEIVDRSGWSDNNGLVLMLTGSGERAAVSYNGNASSAPVLHVEYTTGDDTPPDPVNIPPVADDDTATVAEDGQVTLNVLANDSDADGDAVTVTNVDTAGTKGVVSLRADGTIGYDPSGQFDSLNAGETAVDTFAYTISDGNGGTDTATATVTVTGVDDSDPAAKVVVEVRVAGSSDDAEERPGGAMYVDSSDLELVYDKGDQAVGMRLSNLGIPQGATITNAYLQFQVDEPGATATSLTIRGEDTDDAATFSMADANITSRTATSASVSWAPPAWNSVGEAGTDQRTPNLASIIQEIVGRPGWSGNNSLVLLISGSGERVAESYDGKASAAPLLHVEYTTDGDWVPVNEAPLVEAGASRTIVAGADAALDATVTDDGLPNPPHAVSTTWTKVSGPGTVTFADVASIDTTAGFSKAGVYVLRLTADDGQLTASDDVTINVQNAPTSDELVAFPGAEGFGANSVGGRGGRVIEVTNLNDSGSGSFRAAVEASGPRIVVFRVGGTIVLDSRLELANPYITIAGHTAPGDGILLRNGSNTKDVMRITTNDVVIRYLHFSPGPGGSPDGLTISYDTSYNIVLDHTSFTWGVDELIGTYQAVHDITIQWSLLAEALDDSTHSKGPHSKGVLLGSYDSHSFTFHHNLLAHNAERNPRIQASLVDVVNNVIYNPVFTGGWAPSHASDEKVSGPVAVNYVGNYYKAGPASGSADYLVSGSGDIEIYVKGNITPDRPRDDMDEADGVVRGGDQGMVVSTRHDAPQVTTTSAFQAYEDVLAGAGATMGIDELGNFYYRRTSGDTRIVDTVRNGTGNIVDDPSDVGGWPTMRSATPPADSDHDGMPDAWENLYGFDPNSASNGPKDADGDGYTNVEEYLNGTIPVLSKSLTFASSTVTTVSDEPSAMTLAAVDFTAYEDSAAVADDGVMQASAVDLALTYGEEDLAQKDSLSTSSTALAEESAESLLSEELDAKPATSSEQADLVDLALELGDLLSDDDSLFGLEDETDLLLSIV